MGSYVPSTASERQIMLDAIGLSSLDELFSDIPQNLRFSKLDLPEGKSELEVSSKMQEIAAENKIFHSIFRGAGAYNHYIPAIVKSVVNKEEFVTAYTPYQAEISQGVLQSIFEYQTMICELLSMDVSNASVYDGASAAAEAVAMCRDRKRSRVLVSQSVNPMVLRTMKTYCSGFNTEVEIVPIKDGKTDAAALSSMLGDDTACFYLQNPNYFGLIEDAAALGQLVHEAGARYIMGVNPIACALIKTPGECGADIAVSEGQPLGMPLSFGGPYLGIMACRSDMMRKLPGRIVGETVDEDGQRAFVLTLQTREQHIRREKASSNICSNQALCAMTAAVYLSAMGERGLPQVAQLCFSKAHYAAKQICTVPGFSKIFGGEYFHEFVTSCPADPDLLMDALEQRGILGGYPTKEGILWCVTEMNTKEQIDALVDALKEVCSDETDI